MFNAKDPISMSLKSFFVYKFLYLGCNTCQIVEATRNLSIRNQEHLKTDKMSHFFRHLVNDKTCQALSTKFFFRIIDPTSTPFRLKLKETIYIIWTKALLNKEQKHVSILITFQSSFKFLPFYLFISFYSLKRIAFFLNISFSYI